MDLGNLTHMLGPVAGMFGANKVTQMLGNNPNVKVAVAAGGGVFMALNLFFKDHRVAAAGALLVGGLTFLAKSEAGEAIIEKGKELISGFVNQASKLFGISQENDKGSNFPDVMAETKGFKGKDLAIAAITKIEELNPLFKVAHLSEVAVKGINGKNVSESMDKAQSTFEQMLKKCVKSNSEMFRSKEISDGELNEAKGLIKSGDYLNGVLKMLKRKEELSSGLDANASGHLKGLLHMSDLDAVLKIHLETHQKSYGANQVKKTNYVGNTIKFDSAPAYGFSPAMA